MNQSNSKMTGSLVEHQLHGEEKPVLKKAPIIKNMMNREISFPKRPKEIVMSRSTDLSWKDKLRLTEFTQIDIIQKRNMNP